MKALGDAGLVDVRVVAHFDPFKGTSKETTAAKYGVRGMNLAATKP